MRRLKDSYNDDNISDEEIDEVFYGLVAENAEIRLEPRDHGTCWFSCQKGNQKT